MKYAARRVHHSARSPEAGGPAVRRASEDDVALIEALRRGDEESFASLVDQHHETLRRIARLYVSSPAVADEVVQDTWLAVIRGVWAFEGRSSLKTWILRILINQAKTRAVREGRTVPLLDTELVDHAPHEDFKGASRRDAGDAAGGLARRSSRDALDSPSDLGDPMAALYDPGLSPEAHLLSEEARLRIRGAIDALPANQRVVITMRDLENCSSEEVCNTLGLSETNQRVLLHRARSNVRAMLMSSFGRSG